MVIKSGRLLQEAKATPTAPPSELTRDCQVFMHNVAHKLLAHYIAHKWIFKEMERLSRISVTSSSWCVCECGFVLFCCKLFRSQLALFVSFIIYSIHWDFRQVVLVSSSIACCLFIYISECFVHENNALVYCQCQVCSWRELSLRQAHSWRNPFKLVAQHMVCMFHHCTVSIHITKRKYRYFVHF